METTTSPNIQKASQNQLLLHCGRNDGGGEMAQRIRELDWSKTELGPIENWSQNLVSIVSTILSSSLPINMYLGDKSTMVYNDAYAPIIGKKHPFALGTSAQIVYSEIWKEIEPLLENTKAGKAVTIEDDLFFMLHEGKLEERYFTYSVSPIMNELGVVEGVLNPAIETTSKVIEQRRLKTLKDIAIDSDSLDQTITHCMTSIGKNSKDFPFALLYTVDKNILRLNENVVSIDITKNNIPLSHDMNSKGTDTPNPRFSFYLQTCLSQNRIIIIEQDIQDCFQSLPLSPFGDPISTVAVIPIHATDLTTMAGVLILGLNTRRPFDESFHSLLDLISRQISQVITSVTSFEQGKKRAEELAKLDAAKTEFFNNVSHEFRTPLALMLGPISDSLADTKHPLDSVQRERQELIHRNATRLLKLVNTLLNFSRIEAGKTDTKFVPTNISKLTGSLCALFETVIKRSELQYVLDIEQIHEHIYLDTGMYEKIVMNLLSNAYKFTLKGAIKVSLHETEDNTVELKVQDSGVGIPEDEIPNLFTRFHRVKNSKGRSFEGSGIGLAMIQELVKLHHGTMRVQSKLGQGTCFTVTFLKGKNHLPLDRIKDKGTPEESQLDQAFIEEAALWAPDETTYQKPSTPVSDTDSISSLEQDQETIIKGRVLLVDDNKDMRSYISNTLKRYWTVDIATNGAEALELLEREPIDVIVSDVMMPVMDGFELIRRIRTHQQHCFIPIILLSARAGEEAKIEGLVRGADDYLVKTNFSAKELVARVNIHMELAKLRYKLEGEIAKRTREIQKVNQELQMEIQKRIQSENRYRLLTNSAPVGICHLNQDGFYMYANESLLQTLQFREDQEHHIHQCNLFDMIHPDDIAALMDKWHTFQKNPHQRPLKSIHRIKCHDGTIKWIYLQIICESDQTDEQFCFIGTQTDITAMKNLEEQNLLILKQAEEQQRLRAIEAELSKKQKEEFIDTVCHEIRNPLNGIVGNIDILIEKLEELRQNYNARTDIDPQVSSMKQSINSIQECAAHQADITNDVLSLSRLEAGKEEVNEIPCNTNQIIESVLNMFSSQVTEKNIKVLLQLSTENNEVMIDSLKWKQIVINLFINAIKFSKQNGNIRIAKSATTLSNNQIKLTLEIGDDGIGLDEAEQKNLFGKFYQVTHSIGKKYNGSGLGLAITSRLVHLLNGEVKVKSAKNEGSTFTVSLVCKPIPNSISATTTFVVTPPVAFLHSNHSSILIVEDNEINQKILKKLIEKKGFDCEIANNGREAVELCSEKSFALIFMDIVMPEMNGYEATKEIRKLEQHSLTPIIAVSGNARGEYINKAQEIGMNDYICKPFKADSIFQIIDKYTFAKKDAK